MQQRVDLQVHVLTTLVQLPAQQFFVFCNENYFQHCSLNELYLLKVKVVDIGIDLVVAICFGFRSERCIYSNSLIIHLISWHGRESLSHFEIRVICCSFVYKNT